MSEPIDDLLARIRRGLTFAPGTWDRGDMRLLLERSAAEIERLTAELDAERKFVRDEAKTLMVDMPAPGSDIAKVMRVNAMLRADAAALREALIFYERPLSHCNRHSPEGDAARHTLAKDRGETARAALARAGGGA